ncbi:MAG: HAD family hydrolase [Candidatus Aenigmarchaeota archaeon]|nr:HAD family hydrolase [Candidatus Aenigmarchaeota archaeon]
MPKNRVALFDLDGVLADNTNVSLSADMAAMEIFSLEAGERPETLYSMFDILKSEAIRTDPYDRGRLHLYEKLAMLIGARNYLDAYRAFCQTIERNTRPTEIFGHLYPLIINAASDSFIVTDNQTDTAYLKLRKLNLALPSESVVTSKTIGRRKREEEYWTKLFELIGAYPERCVVLGDSEARDIRHPKNLGAMTVLYSDSASSDNSRADIHVRSPIDVRKVLRNI